jgi:tRNA-Thr(GGU) m(6)t(6)A37 methyltransferase TsaA
MPPASSSRASDSPLPPVGVVRSAYALTEETPVQARLNPDADGAVELEASYAAGLADLAGFDFAWLLTWLHRPHDTAPPRMRQVPFLLRSSGREVGMFATRSPRRPNPIGLSLVEVVAVSEARLEFRGVDVVDGTPVLDVKPYVRRFDDPGRPVRCGWFDEIELRDGVRPADL